MGNFILHAPCMEPHVQFGAQSQWPADGPAPTAGGQLRQRAGLLSVGGGGGVPEPTSCRRTLQEARRPPPPRRLLKDWPLRNSLAVTANRR